jgi:hypothetical protein
MLRGRTAPIGLGICIDSIANSLSRIEPRGCYGYTQRMRVRISSLTFGRPPQDRDRQRQYSRKPARCHLITVSGFTMIRTSDHPGQRLRRVVQKKRSRRFRQGRRCLRLSTATCWRNARISSEVSRRLRKKTRKAARTAGIKSSTNQRCNMGQCRRRCGARCKIANCRF